MYIHTHLVAVYIYIISIRHEYFMYVLLKFLATAEVPVLRHGHYTLNAIARYVDLVNSAAQGNKHVEMPEYGVSKR